MPANYVSNATRAALSVRRRDLSIAGQEAGCEWVVIRVQKNGKRPIVARHDGVSRFTEEAARDWARRFSEMNPTAKVEVERR